MNRATITRALLKRARKLHQFLIHVGLRIVSRAKAAHRESLARVEAARYAECRAAGADVIQATLDLHRAEVAEGAAHRRSEAASEACAAERAVLGL